LNNIQTSILTNAANTSFSGYTTQFTPNNGIGIPIRLTLGPGTSNPVIQIVDYTFNIVY